MPSSVGRARRLGRIFSNVRFNAALAEGVFAIVYIEYYIKSRVVALTFGVTEAELDGAESDSLGISWINAR